VVQKVAQCLGLAGQYANPENINARTANYTTAAKSLQALDRLIGKFDQISAPLRNGSGKNIAVRLENVQAVLRHMRRDFSATMEYLEHEAAFGNRHGNTQIRSVRDKDAIEMNQTWREKNQWQLEAVEQALAGVKSARELLQLAKKKAGAAGQETEWKEMLEMIVSYEGNLHQVEAWKAAGGIEDRYHGLDERQLETWRSRLEWVKQVDSWIAQGLTGRELEKMKEKQAKGKRIRRDE
jgi:hypothetical protein